MSGFKDFMKHRVFQRAESTSDGKRSIKQLILQEARSVSLWSCGSLLLRLIVELLIAAAGMDHMTRIAFFGFDLSVFHGSIRYPARLLLAMLPNKVARGKAPGFYFGNPWLLIWSQSTTGVMPSLPCRLCEYVLGRLTLSEIAAIIPIHYVCFISTSVVFQHCLPKYLSGLVLSGLGSEDDFVLASDLLREPFISILFTTGLLVIPVLCNLNHIPTWMATLVLYPCFNYSVNGSGLASTFSPNALLGLELLGNKAISVGTMAHSITLLLGGYMAGKLMARYFPDGPSAGVQIAKA